MTRPVQTPDDLRAMADAAADDIANSSDQPMTAFMCMALYGAADELDRRHASAADGLRHVPLHEIVRDKQIVRLRAEAPLRVPVEQHDVDGLGLFDAHRSPKLL